MSLAIIDKKFAMFFGLAAVTRAFFKSALMGGGGLINFSIGWVAVLASLIWKNSIAPPYATPSFVKYLAMQGFTLPNL